MKIRYMIEFKKIFFVILMCIESQNIICSNITTHYNDTSNRYVYYDTITMTERVDRRNDSLATDVYYITDTIIVKYDTTPRPYMINVAACLLAAALFAPQIDGRDPRLVQSPELACVRHAVAVFVLPEAKG